MRLLRLVAMVCAAACCSHAVAAGLSIARGLETTRFATDRRGESVFVSPDGHRYAVMLIRGDIARDGVDVTLLVGRLDRREAGVPRAVLRLFTQALSGGFAAYFGANQLVAPDSNPPVWLDDTTLGMLWEDTAGTRQILRVDVEHGTQSWLTASTTPVVRFSALTPDALLFDAAMPVDYDTARRREQAGYAVDDADALELLHGGVRGVWDWMRHETFLVTSHHPEPRPIEFLGGEAVSRYLPRITPVSSHDGGRVLIAHTLSDAQLPDEWARYTQPHFRDMWQARADPTSFYARQFQQLFVLDMRSATARPLWPVPVDGLGRTQTAWSPTDTEVVLVPTFLPLAQSDASALAGDAAAIVNVDTGQSTRLPVEPSLAASIAQLHWNGTDRIDADLSDGRRLAWTRQADGWDVHIYVSDAPAAPSVPVKVLQDLNEPPVLATIDAGGVPHVLLDPNPQLSQQLLG
jgi:hypothetical protein